MTIATAPESRRATARNAAIIVGLSVAVLIGVLATRRSVTDKVALSPLVGKEAPEISGPSLRDGKVLTLSSLRGRWVVVNFFATWCTACIKEHPELVKFSTDHHDDATVLAVVFDDDPGAVRQFFTERGGDWPVIDAPRTAVDYGVAKIPETFLVSPDGVVVAKANGAITAKSIEERMR